MNTDKKRRGPGIIPHPCKSAAFVVKNPLFPARSVCLSPCLPQDCYTGHSLGLPQFPEKPMATKNHKKSQKSGRFVSLCASSWQSVIGSQATGTHLWPIESAFIRTTMPQSVRRLRQCWWRTLNRRDTKSAERQTATRNDRIMAGQNHNDRHRSILMILSCHDSVCFQGWQRKSSWPGSKLVDSSAEVTLSFSFSALFVSLRLSKAYHIWLRLGCSVFVVELNSHVSEARVNRFAFKGQHAKNSFMHAAQRFFSNEPFQ